MNKSEFHREADHTLEDFSEKIEKAYEDHVEDLDITYSVIFKITTEITPNDILGRNFERQFGKIWNLRTQ